MPKIDIEWDALDGLVVGALNQTIETTRAVGDEPEYDDKIIEAAKLLIRHYGGRVNKN